jgi:phosphomevalonate kinase
LSAADVDVVCRCSAIGVAAGVPIEPKEQTALADATLSKVKGVLAAGVPGAGGFDALFAIHLEPQDLLSADEGAAESSHKTTVRDSIEELWLDWPGGGLTPLLLSNGPAHGEKGAGAEITFSSS